MDDKLIKEQIFNITKQAREEMKDHLIDYNNLSKSPFIERVREIPRHKGRVKVIFGQHVDAVDQKRPLLINIHGGGFIRPGTERDLWFCQALAEEFGMHYVHIIYSLSPEHPYPLAAKECYSAIHFILGASELYHTKQDSIYIVGREAGANLALGVVQKLCSRNLPKPARLILDSPIMDVSMRIHKAHVDAGKIPLLSEKLFYQLAYVGEHDAVDPILSPSYMNPLAIGTFPPTLILEPDTNIHHQMTLGLAVKLKMTTRDIKYCDYDVEDDENLDITGGYHKSSYDQIVEYLSQTNDF